MHTCLASLARSKPTSLCEDNENNFSETTANLMDYHIFYVPLVVRYGAIAIGRIGRQHCARSGRRHVNKALASRNASLIDRLSSEKAIDVIVDVDKRPRLEVGSFAHRACWYNILLYCNTLYRGGNNFRLRSHLPLKMRSRSTRVTTHLCGILRCTAVVP